MSDANLYLFSVEGIDQENLASLLDPQRWRWLYAERLETTALAFLADVLADEVPLARWQHGRAFDQAGELAWWRQEGGRYELRLLTESAQPALGDLNWRQGQQWQPAGDVQETLLHGTRDDEVAAEGEGRWSEARIPRWLRYPVETAEEQKPPKHVVLVTQAYGQNGVVGLTRLLAVRGLEVEDGHV